MTVPSLSGTDNWRVITQRVNYRVLDPFTGQTSNGAGTLVVGADLGDINGTIRQLTVIDLVVSGFVVLGLAIAGVAIVRASLRPLGEIEVTAERIAAGDLSRCVPDHDPRTEIGRLGRSLNSMLSQIEFAFHVRSESEAAARRSEERMRQFVADASHELRTPLTAIRGFAEYYRQRASPGKEAAAGQHADQYQAGAMIPARPVASAHGDESPAMTDLGWIMQRVEQESTRMGGLVDDLLLLARLDQQRPVDRDPVDLLALAADAIRNARMMSPDRQIHLTIGTGTVFLILGDEARLRQVINNLIGNAVTHTPDGTQIDVRLSPGTIGSAPGVHGRFKIMM